jgi:hypothetical protein
MPDLFAGPRDPVTKGEMLVVTENPTEFDGGAEVEVAIGVSLPVYRLAGRSPQDALVVGAEASAFARFTLQVLERELVATDWVFAVPVIWHRGHHWMRLRYYHTSSHLGDEYARRFDLEGVNFARDAVDALGLVRLTRAAGAYLGVRWAYNVHPEESRRWTARVGMQLGHLSGRSAVIPYAAADLEVEQDTDWRPRLNLQAGLLLPEVAGRRAIRAGIGFLTGPSPLGQFQGQHTTQLSIGVTASL